MAFAVDNANFRVGVVGTGYWGSKHVRVLSNLHNVGQVVVIDPDATRRDNLVAAFPGSIGFESLRDALPHVDAVVIATPADTHAELALEALHAGKHVLVEKPMTTTVADAEELVRTANRFDRTLMVGHTFEYNNAVKYLREMVQGGGLGDLYYIDAARLNLGLYRPDVNVVWDLAPHDISIANYILDARPVAIEAWGGRHAHTAQEDLAYLRLHYEDPKITVQTHVSWLSPSKVRRTTLVGSSKMAIYDDLSDDDRVRVFDKGIEVPDDEAALHGVPQSYRNGEIVSPYIKFDEPLSVMNAHFLECAALGTTPRSDGLSGLHVVEALCAADEALRTGQAVELPRRNGLEIVSGMAPATVVPPAPSAPLKIA